MGRSPALGTLAGVVALLGACAAPMPAQAPAPPTPTPTPVVGALLTLDEISAYLNAREGSITM